MRASRVLLIASIAFATNSISAHEPAQPVVEKCGVIFESSTGKPELRLLAGLSVLAISDSGEFVLPSDAPSKVLAVQCGRAALIPSKNDYKVLLAGFPFSIVSDERVGVLEVVEGHVRFNMLHGEMTEAELEPIGKYLDFAQAEMAAKE